MSSDLFSGKYFFHCHTPYTDGKVTVEEYFRFAREQRLERIIFLEHIRKTPKYSVENFQKDVLEWSRRSGIEAIAGFEAKILPDGMLDIEENLFERAPVIGIAEHGFPGDGDAMIAALSSAFKHYGRYTSDKTIVWVHPGLYFHKKKLTDQFIEPLELLCAEAVRNGIVIERNIRYRLPDLRLMTAVNNIQTCLGADAHTQEDLVQWISEFGKL